MQLQFKTHEARIKHRILIVDDYPDAADVACMLLRILGHECQSAHTGKQALDTAAVFEPDIAILDIGLPDISGYDVARELRTHRWGQRMHLAAVTGWGAPADRVRALAAGFDQHVLKPTDAVKIRMILKLADSAQDARPSVMPKSPRPA